MNDVVKAIPTRYKGYHFRSRLEARWAVFFDALAFPWEYEPQGFALGDGLNYLPDFRVKRLSSKNAYHWYEIKPDGPFDTTKFELFEGHLQKPWLNLDGDGWSFSNEASHGQVLTGIPTAPMLICPKCGWIMAGEEACRLNEGEMGVLCHPCDFTMGTGDELWCEYFNIMVTYHKGMLLIERENWFDRCQRAINYAIQAARSARFEHGESGAT